MPSDVVFLTGATGFVGGHVLDRLMAAGYEVRALVRRPDVRLRDGVKIVVGDVREAGRMVRELCGARYLVHCAAEYSFAPGARAALESTNVAGTAGLLEAARLAGIERAVVTSSSATVGPAPEGRAATEEDVAPEGPPGYHHSKLAQERVAVAARVPTVLLLPTAPIGPGDRKPTPTGKIVVDYARGRLFAKPPRGGLNVVPVEDVADAHVAALRLGRPRERYLLGGANLSLDALWELLARTTGRPVPVWRAPFGLALAVAHVDGLRCRLDPAAVPFAPLEGVRMAAELRYVDSSKARRELGFRAGSVEAALQRAITWFRANDYVAA
ncbi:MAG: NAD-dependent epimerase/dehydratase family protein [Candidatus Baltobacteraceae bacterium]